MKYVGNEISYHIGNTDKTEYLNNKTNSLSVINQNMGLYKQLPKNMVTGIIDNFKTTFNKQNFLNYLNPNTSYAELKDYSKSVIQTGVTAYGGYKLGEFAYNKISTIVTNNSNISSLGIDNDYTSYKLNIPENEMRYTVSENSNYITYNSNILSQNIGWNLGDPIDNLTKSGKYPSWNTVRARYWKNEAFSNFEAYSNSDLNLMKSGRPPIYPGLNVPMELHHINGRNILNPHNINNLQQLWPWEHSKIDPFRFYNGPRP